MKKAQKKSWAWEFQREFHKPFNLQHLHLCCIRYTALTTLPSTQVCISDTTRPHVINSTHISFISHIHHSSYCKNHLVFSSRIKYQSGTLVTLPGYIIELNYTSVQNFWPSNPYGNPGWLDTQSCTLRVIIKVAS